MKISRTPGDRAQPIAESLYRKPGFVVSLAVLLTSAELMADSPDQQAVRCVEIAFSQSVENRDQAAFTAMLDADTRFISNQVVHGPQAVTESWAGFFETDGPQLVWRPYFVEVAAGGDLAFSRGPYRLRGQNQQGEQVESWGIYNSVWRKSATGQWKILFDAGNPGEQQLSEEMKALIDQPISGC